MNHSEISVWDIAIIAVYLIVMISVGVYFIRRVKNSGDYYVAGRSFGPLVLMATVCATIIGGSGLMGRFMVDTFSDLILRVGLSILFSGWWGSTGIWLSWPVGWTVGTLLSVLFYSTAPLDKIKS